jgi:hypothetical protein
MELSGVAGDGDEMKREPTKEGNVRVERPVRRQIEMNGTEAKDLLKFCKKHVGCLGNNRVRVSAESDGIGDAITVECMGCGETKGIEDVTSW